MVNHEISLKCKISAIWLVEIACIFLIFLFAIMQIAILNKRKQGEIMLKTKCIFFFLVYTKILSLQNVFGLLDHVPFKASPLPLLQSVSGVFSSIKFFANQPVENTSALRQRFHYTAGSCMFFSCFLNSWYFKSCFTWQSA